VKKKKRKKEETIQELGESSGKCGNWYFHMGTLVERFRGDWVKTAHR